MKFSLVVVGLLAGVIVSQAFPHEFGNKDHQSKGKNKQIESFDALNNGQGNEKGQGQGKGKDKQVEAFIDKVKEGMEKAGKMIEQAGGAVGEVGKKIADGAVKAIHKVAEIAAAGGGKKG